MFKPNLIPQFRDMKFQGVFFILDFTIANTAKRTTREEGVCLQTVNFSVCKGSWPSWRKRRRRRMSHWKLNLHLLDSTGTGNRIGVSVIHFRLKWNLVKWPFNRFFTFFCRGKMIFRRSTIWKHIISLYLGLITFEYCQQLLVTLFDWWMG